MDDRATIPDAPRSQVRARVTVLHEVWRPREDEPGVTTFEPICLCVVGVREGDAWALELHEVSSAMVEHDPRTLSKGEREDIERKLLHGERMRADDARKEQRRAV